MSLLPSQYCEIVGQENCCTCKEHLVFTQIQTCPTYSRNAPQPSSLLDGAHSLESAITVCSMLGAEHGGYCAPLIAGKLDRRSPSPNSYKAAVPYRQKAPFAGVQPRIYTNRYGMEHRPDSTRVLFLLMFVSKAAQPKTCKDTGSFFQTELNSQKKKKGLFREVERDSKTEFQRLGCKEG